jgi:hypothetical protein
VLFNKEKIKNACFSFIKTTQRAKEQRVKRAQKHKIKGNKALRSLLSLTLSLFHFNLSFVVNETRNEMKGVKGAVRPLSSFTSLRLFLSLSFHILV